MRVLLAAAALVVLAGCGGSRTNAFHRPPESPDLPSAPPSRAHRAERIAGADLVVAQLLRRGGDRRASTSAWDGVDGRPLGVDLIYDLRRPILVDSIVPYVAIPPDAPSHGDCMKPYAPGWEHLRARRVTQLQVLVDLRRGRVAEIGTDGSGTVGPVSGKPFPSCDEDTSG